LSTQYTDTAAEFEIMRPNDAESVSITNKKVDLGLGTTVATVAATIDVTGTHADCAGVVLIRDEIYEDFECAGALSDACA